MTGNLVVDGILKTGFTNATSSVAGIIALGIITILGVLMLVGIANTFINWLKNIFRWDYAGSGYDNGDGVVRRDKNDT